MNDIPLDFGEKVDLDLGDQHFLQFFTYQGCADRHVGALIYHRDPKSETGWCSGGVAWQKGSPTDNRPLWTLTTQADEHITLSPSIRCLRCGDHGYIRDGRWVGV